MKVYEKLDNLVIVLVNLPKMPLPLPKRPDVKKGYTKLLLITQKNQPNTMLLPHYFNASKLLINMKIFFANKTIVIFHCKHQRTNILNLFKKIINTILFDMSMSTDLSSRSSSEIVDFFFSCSSNSKSIGSLFKLPAFVPYKPSLKF
mgnify:CR=1 FL=1